MKRWFRPRIGRDDDVVWEIKSAFFFFLPAKWGWGFREYANEAAQRNRISIELNTMAKEFEAKIVKFAEAEASLKSERDSLKEKKYNHLGVGTPGIYDTKDFKNMFPYVDDPEHEWKAFVNKSVWKRILKSYGADESVAEQSKRHGNMPKTQGRVMISPSDAVEKHSEFFAKDGAEQLVRYRPPEQKRGSSSGTGEKKPQNFKALRGDHPKRDGESQNEYDDRIRGIFKDMKDMND